MAVLLPIWIAMGIACAVWLAVAALLPAPPLGALGPAPFLPMTARLQPLFVVDTDDGIVLDGLLHLATTPVGIPTAWRLHGPADHDARHLALTLLEEWADHDELVDVDLSAVRAVPPSIELSCRGDRFRLALTTGSPTADR